jgi:hypothetical protein
MQTPFCWPARRPALASLVLLVYLAACSAGDTQSALVTVDTLVDGTPRVHTRAPLEEGHWTLELERELNPTRGAPGELVNPTSVAIADDGELYVAEGDPVAVRRYTSDGQPAGIIGRFGEGPGEFRYAHVALNGDTLVVHDFRTRRATAFERNSGTILATAPTGCCFPENPVFAQDGALWTRSGLTRGPDGKHRQTVLRSDLRSGTTDTLLFTQEEFDGKRQWALGRLGQFDAFAPIPMVPTNMVALSPDGVITGWSATYLLRLHRNGPGPDRAFGRTWSPSEVSSAERADFVEHEVASLLLIYPSADPVALRTAMPATDIPAVRPAFDRIIADQAGRTWVVSGLPTSDSVLVDLFDGEGRWLDQLRQPASLWRGRVTITAERLLSIAEDAEGFPRIRIYRVARK